MAFVSNLQTELWSKYAKMAYNIPKVIKVQSILRTHLARRRYRGLVHNQTQRLNIAKELMETERTYVAGLDTIITHFLDRLRHEKQSHDDEANKEHLLSEDQLLSIIPSFSILRNIHVSNKMFLADLEERISIWKENDSIVDILATYAPIFKCYTYYCQNYDTLIANLRVLRNQNPRFDKFFYDFQIETNQALQTLLITPVQRIPRYILLLQSMYKSTSPDHRDYKILKTLLHELDLITQKVNRGIEQVEGLSKVVSIQHQLAGILPEEASTLVAPGRCFVREGLVQFCNFDSWSHKQFKDHWFFLFNDALIYARYKPHKEEKYTSCGILFFSGDLRCKDIEDMEVAKNLFFIITTKKTITVRCSSIDEKRKWMEDITHHSSHTTENLKSLAHSQSEFTPKALSDKLTINIIKTQTIISKNKEYTVYTIKVLYLDKSTRIPKKSEKQINRRYREFYQLRKNIDSNFELLDKKLMDLPQKHLIGNLQKDVIESRRIMLQGFLEELVSHDALCRLPQVLQFLELPLDYFDAPNHEPYQTQTLRTRKNTLDRLLDGLKNNHHNNSNKQSNCNYHGTVPPITITSKLFYGLGTNTHTPDDKYQMVENEETRERSASEVKAEEVSWQEVVSEQEPPAKNQARKSRSVPSSPPHKREEKPEPPVWFKNTNTYRVLNRPQQDKAGSQDLRPHALLKMRPGDE